MNKRMKRFPESQKDENEDEWQEEDFRGLRGFEG